MAEPKDVLAVWTDVLRRVAVCNREMRKAFADAAAQAGLAESEFLVLWSCQNGPPEGTAQCDLAAWLALSPAQVSGLVERLRTRALLCRLGCLDRRRQQWQTTPEGAALVGQVGECLTGLTRRWDAQVPAESRRQMLEALQILCDLSKSPVQPRAAGKEAA